MKYGIQVWFWSYKGLIGALGQVSRLCISMGATAVKCQQQSHMPMTAVEKHSLLRTSATVLRRTFDLHGECVDLSWRAAAMFDLEIQKLFFAGTTADPWYYPYSELVAKRCAETFTCICELKHSMSKVSTYLTLMILSCTMCSPDLSSHRLSTPLACFFYCLFVCLFVDLCCRVYSAYLCINLWVRCLL